MNCNQTYVLAFESNRYVHTYTLYIKDCCKHYAYMQGNKKNLRVFC